MKIIGWRSTTFLIAVSLPASLASAQWDASTSEAPTTATPAPAPPPAPPEQMVSAPPPHMVSLPEEKRGPNVSFTWSLGIGVPIILDVPRDNVRPGANIFFFGGADFGFFILGGATGLQWNPIDLDGLVVNGVALSGRNPLSRIYLSIPEVRFQIPDLKIVLPYISGSFDMNFWNFLDTGYACGYWYCSAYSVYRFTPGFTGRAGLGFEIKGGVYIDTGFQYSFTGKGNFFEESGWWLAPYVGVLVRKR
ncbi:MAG: hypothetical protein WCE62_06080 [Polyangiales bacterium]